MVVRREREKVYSPQYNNTVVTVSNNTKWRAARKAQGPSYSWPPIVTKQ